jgi:hypothetical protein
MMPFLALEIDRTHRRPPMHPAPDIPPLSSCPRPHGRRGGFEGAVWAVASSPACLTTPGSRG